MFGHFMYGWDTNVVEFGVSATVCSVGECVCVMLGMRGSVTGGVWRVMVGMRVLVVSR